MLIQSLKATRTNIKQNVKAICTGSDRLPEYLANIAQLRLVALSRDFYGRGNHHVIYIVPCYSRGDLSNPPGMVHRKS